VKKSGKSFLWVWLILAISLTLNLYGINWGLPNGDQDWANDSIAPLEPLAYAKRLIYQEPWWSKYPPFHFMVLALFYAPYTLYLYFTGGLTSPTDFYPYGFKDPEFSLMVFTLIARVTSALMGTGTVLVNYYTVKILYGCRAGLISALLIASCYPVIYYSHNANVDVPQLFWISLALYSFVALLKTYETKYYLLLGLFTALAIGTKDSGYALFPGIVLVLLYFHLRHEQATRGNGQFLSALIDRKLLYGFSVFVIALILVFNLPFNLQGLAAHVQFHLGRSVEGGQVIRESASVVHGDLRLITKYLIYFIQANGLPSFLLLIGGFFYCLLRFPKSWILVIPIVTYYIFFLRIYVADHLRYMLPAYLILTWQAGKFAADLLECRKIPKLISTTAISLILAHSLVYGFSLDLLLIRDSRYSAEKWMKENIPSGTVVAAVGPDYGLPRFLAGMQVRRIRPTRGEINIPLLDSAESAYLILNMSLPRRAPQRSAIYQMLQEKDFHPVGSFKSPTPIFGADLFHAVNPEIVIFQQIRDRSR